MRIKQEEVYRKFASNYGVIVGRVIANGGFGVPNAKVSVFIPISEEDKNDVVISQIYPYERVDDINNEGVRYNLLEDEKQSNCHVPVGTFPNKRKVLDNEVILEIYDKYYKYTTVTNESGDYMIFGVPTGQQTVHMDVDLSDIGFLSLKPYDLINQGYNPNLFSSNTEFKSSTDLESLVQIQSSNQTLNVLPFWGDVEENEIGINRVDFNLNNEITPVSVFFGSIFTDSTKNILNRGCRPRKTLGRNCDLSTGTGIVETIRRIAEDSNVVEFLDNNDIDEDGNWAIPITMNLDRVVTDEFGNLIPSQDPTVGIPTKALVRFRLSLDEHRFGIKKRTAHYLVPNMYNRYDFDENVHDDDMYEMRWNKLYTVSNYIPRYQKNANDENKNFIGIKQIGECENTQSFPYNRIDIDGNVLYLVLCVIIAAVGQLIDIINFIINLIIFKVVLVFICFVKHPFNSEKRGACRCQSCLNLNTGVNGGTTEIPSDWNLNPPTVDTNSNNIDDRLECAVCYDGGDGSQTYAIKTSTSLVSSVTTDPVDTVTSTTLTNVVGTSSNGEGAEFTIELGGNGQISNIFATSGGNGYSVGDTITFDSSNFGSNDKVITLQSSDLQTTVIIDGTPVDCSGFTYSLCDKQCDDCDLSLIPLQCESVSYTSGSEWSECVRQQLALSLGVVDFEFYNDWVVGSLYSFLFKYKLKFRRRRRKSLEKFCDLDCREAVGTPSGDEHYKNKCRRSYIVDRAEFDNVLSDSERVEINPQDGRGLVVEYEDFLYYGARHDYDSNPLNPSGLTVEQKYNLLFATNIVELGGRSTCDLDGVPFLVNRLESTTYQREEGISTLFNVAGCTSSPPVQDIHYKGIQLISQIGVDILVAEAERLTGAITGSDGETYTFNPAALNEADIPDYDGNNAIIIFDRDDIIIRQYLCENFPYYGISGVYNTTEHPIVGNDYLTDEDGDTVESLTDVCSGFDDLTNNVERIHPYYFYFGIRQGNSALDKLKKEYFDTCID